jgi:hypothetical protein
VADLYVVRHLEKGPIATALTPVDAGRHVALIACDDPDALASLRIEPFDVRVAEPSSTRLDG